MTTHFPRATFSTLATAALALLACAHTVAQTDPTRPPPGLQTASTDAAPDALGALVLQSVLLGSGRKPAAVISGQLVQLGGVVGGLRLSHVSPTGVRLTGPEGVTSLSLMPTGQKTVRATRTEISK